MPQTNTTARVRDGRIITLQPLTSILSARTRELLRTIGKDRHAANRVLRADRPHRLR